MPDLLDNINGVEDLRKLGVDQLEPLAEEIRDLIVDVVSRNGGHLAPSLGVVELTMALHYVFRTPFDTLIWDVGHQTYTHKILTGRRDRFHTIRTLGGLSGFPKREESPFDAYDVGHSSTSISLALGESFARDLRGDGNQVIAVIGDGSLNSGIAFEALNHLGNSGRDIIVILNDNEHSISKNVGAMSEYLTKVITGQLYNEMRSFSMRLVRAIPVIGQGLFDLIYKTLHGIKGVFVPGQLFEDMGLRYFGPVDGHNLEMLVELFESMKSIEPGPKLIHVITKKGKGYSPAEKDPARFHGIGSFDRETGESLPKKGTSYSTVAGTTLSNLAKNDKKIVAITAAMKHGTGLVDFEKVAPERMYDVGIAEQHAVTFASALASAGKKPFVFIYSTFLQRATDQVIHDVAIMKHPVRILVDRAGLVGDDGETHHGVFDITLFKNVPGLIFLAPSNGEELRDAIGFAAAYNTGPVMIRYPRGSVPEEQVDYGDIQPLEPGRSRILEQGKDVVFVAAGDMVSNALEARQLLSEKGIDAGVVNILSICPLDMETISSAVENAAYVVTLENGYRSGGIGQEIAAGLPPHLRSRLLFNGGFPREFVTHGPVEKLQQAHGLDSASLADRIAGEIQERTRVQEKPS